MIRLRGIVLFILVVAACSLTGFASAQSSGSDMVYVTATVTGPKKAPAPGLKKENFQLFEDGIEQKITGFAGTDGVWDIDVILGNSQLLPGNVDRTSSSIRDAVETFKKSGNPDNRIKVEELKFGSDGLYAAIDRNLVDLQKTTNPRRALIVITDGFDQHYKAAANLADLSNVAGHEAAGSLVEYSRKLNIPIYFLFTPPDETDASGNKMMGRGRAPLSNSQLRDQDTLTTVAEQTGGAFYTIDALHQLEALCKVLAEDLRKQYVLGFKSTNDSKDDKWRNLKLKLTPPAGQKVEASMKKKYFVPKPLNK